MRKLLLALLIALTTPLLFAETVRHELTNGNQTVLQFQLDDYRLQSQREGDGDYTRIAHPEAVPALEKGKPELPQFASTIAIPATGNVRLEWQIETSETIEDIDVYPSQGVDLSGDNNTFYRDPAIYSQREYTCEPAVTVGDPVIMRDVRMVNLNISPFGWNAQTRQLEVATSIRIAVHYEGGTGVNEIHANRKLSRSFEKFYEANIANWDDIRDDNVEYQDRSILVIYPNVNELETYIESYVDWKRSKGFYIEAHDTGETGSSNSNVLSYIQDCYDTWDSPPEYVVLVGDPSGTYAMPTWYENWSGYSGEGDHPYTMLDGDDYISDVFIGRISIGSVNDFLTFLAKMNLTEIEPNMDDVDMYHRSLLVGDTSPSGLSCVLTNKFIKERLLAVDPNHTFTELYGADPNPTQMDAAINQGIQFFNYRGWLGMSGWGNGNIDGLTNTNKLMNAVILTCGTGSFASGTARSEAVLRAGTPSAPKGGISAIGMSTSGTHTQFNNILSGGIFQGLLVNGVRTMGEALFQGKMDLYAAYAEPTYHYTEIFTHWCNLMGDPTVDVWVGEPKEMNVDFNPSLYQGESNIDITVTDGSGIPIPDAWVTIRKLDTNGNETIFETGYTGENGMVTYEFSHNVSGDVSLVVTKPDYIPFVGGFTIQTGNGIRTQSYACDDDNEDESSGNDDGQANPGETVELILTIRNYSTTTYHNVVAVISTDDPYIQITDDTEEWDTFNGGAIGATPDDYNVIIAPGVPDGHRAQINLVVTAEGDYEWNDRFWLDIAGDDLDISSYTIDDANGILDPGETRACTMTLFNDGQTALNDVYAEITSSNALALYPDSVAYFGDIAIGGSATCTTDGFQIGTLAQILPGMEVEFEVCFYNDSGFEETEILVIPIGEIENGDPIAPDEYGYICYDDNDTNYIEAPDYDWIEIDPDLGGSGTNTGLSDTSSESDEIDFFDLPFIVRFYGVDYDRVGICTNGWISFGEPETEQCTFRNWPIPSGLGPNPMVAAFWDDLLTTNGGIFYQHVQNSTLDAYVIEWSECRNTVSSAQETFQIILYNNAFYSTPTGDTPIKIQYKEFNNVDGSNYDSGAQGNYCTIGLEDHTGAIGLQYSYNNEYATGAASLGDQRAILFTTLPVVTQTPNLALVNVDVVDSDDDSALIYGQVSEFNITLQNSGIETATNVQATISTISPWISILNVQSDFIDIEGGESVVSLQTFQVEISPWCSDMKALPFALQITSDQDEWNYSFGFNCWAPKLEIESFTISDDNSNGYLEPGESADVDVTIVNNGHYEATGLTGYLNTADENITMTTANSSIDDLAAGESADIATPFAMQADADCPVPHSFRLNLMLSSDTDYYALEQIDYLVGYNESCELGENGWTHYDLNSGDDEWHLDAYRSYSPDYSWHAGSHDGENYSENLLMALESPEIELSSGSYLTFRHWMDAEVSGNYPGYCYDGGIVQMFYNEDWFTIDPVDGYPYLTRGESNPPFDPETEVYSGSIDWESAWFDITGYSGTVRFRFVFGSDGGVNREGWYIDNIMLTDSYTAIDPPTDLTAEIDVPNQIGLQWNAPDTDPDTYRVYRSVSLTTPYVQIAETSNTHFTDTDSYTGHFQYYVVTAVEDGQESAFSNTAQVETDYSGQEGGGDVPLFTALDGNYPNPFNPTTCIRYSLAQDAYTELTIYNVRGQLVRTLVSEPQKAGSHEITWYSTDDNRKSVASGVYLYKFKAGDYSRVRKMLLLK